MNFKILGIYPYIGLEHSIKKQASKFPKLLIDHYIGDLDYGIQLATSQLKKKITTR